MRLEGLFPSTARSTNATVRGGPASAVATHRLDDGTRLKVLTTIAAAGLALAATLAASHSVSFSQAQVPVTFAPAAGVHLATGYADAMERVVSVQLDRETGTITASTIEAPSASFAPLDASVVQATRNDRAAGKDASAQEVQPHSVIEAAL